MVKRGLKVGQTFEDGGCTYKVLSVNPDGSYVSTMCEDTSEEETNEVTEETESQKNVSEEPKETEEEKNNTRRRRRAQ